MAVMQPALQQWPEGILPLVAILRGVRPEEVLDVAAAVHEAGVGAANLAPWRQAGCAGLGVGGDLYRAGHPAGEVHRRALALVAAWRASQ